jgi:putative oxidoreductase
MAPSFIPVPIIWVYLVGLAQLAFVVSIITKKKLGLSGMLAGIMLILFVLTVHIPNMSNQDDLIKTLAIVNMLKDFGLAGGAFILSGMYSEDRNV